MNKPLTQAMINAYDEYTHLTLDRRNFMDKLAKLAGSASAAAAIAPLLAASKASAEMVTASDERLTAKDVTYPGSGGEMKGYLVEPKNRVGETRRGDHHSRKPGPQSAYSRRRPPHGPGRLHRACAGLPVARRRHARERGSGARNVRQARSCRDRGQRRGEPGLSCRSLRMQTARSAPSALLGRWAGQQPRNEVSRAEGRRCLLWSAAARRTRCPTSRPR